MRTVESIVILTGAGISAESGLATFRGPDGLWEGHRVEDVRTPEAFARDPALVHAFYDARRAKLAGRAQCGARGAGAARCRVAGRVADRHPERRRPARARRREAAAAHARRADQRLVPAPAMRASRWAGTDGRRRRLARNAACRAACAPTSSGSARCPTRWSGSTARCRRCDLFVSIGTSGAVYPAAGFVQTARYCGARTLEMNLEPSLGSFLFDESRIGQGGRAGAGSGSTRYPRGFSPPSPARSRGRARDPPPISG